MALTKEQIKEFKAEEKEATDIFELSSLANDLVKAGDKEWAKNIYIKAEAVAEDCDDFRRLADSVHENLGDKEWAKKIYKKAEDIVDDCEDLCRLGRSVASGNGLNDKKWARELFQKAHNEAEESDEFEDLLSIGGEETSVADNDCLGDKTWAKKHTSKNHLQRVPKIDVNGI